MLRKISSIILILSLIFLLGITGCNKAEEAAAEEKIEEETITEEPSIEASWKLSTQDKQWQDMEPLTLLGGEGERSDITIDLSSLKQEIDGFGGAFNEKGWEALLLLTPEERDKVIKELFDPDEGAKFNICRVPIGASDYAISRYTLNETKDDFDMNDFSIDRDKKSLIPYINEALKYKTDLKIWGSVWTPPTWMKTNEDFDSGEMKDDPQVYEAFALYLARFVEEYKAEDIDIYAVAVQNEPTIKTNYPSCIWTPDQFLVFIRDHMGPLFEERNMETEIMLGTIQDGDYSAYPETVLSDPTANSYVSIVGFQWEGFNSVSTTRAYYPDKKIMQTETECGNFHWKTGFDPDRPQNDWAYGIYTWNKVKAYFDEGVNSYLLWNIVLDEEGKSIDSERPWPQNAAVVVDKNTKTVTYTPMFYAFKHFTYFIKPGASYVNVISREDNAIAFSNPDGELIIVLQNDEQDLKTLNIRISEYIITITLPGMSWSTLTVPSF
jgi:glucosylceramidase